MPTKHRSIPTLYENVVQVDDKTGEPKDYLSAFVAYRNLTLAAADRVKLPHDDREDAAQEVQLRFWRNDSLAQYDPERTFTTESGQVRTAKFGSMYGSFVGLSMLAERDKHINYTKRMLVRSNDEIYTAKTELTADVADEVTETDAVSRYIETASRALEEAGRPDLQPVLRLCQNAAVLNTVITRADVVAATGCRLRSATKLLQELREILEISGMGPDTLEEAA